MKQPKFYLRIDLYSPDSVDGSPVIVTYGVPFTLRQATRLTRKTLRRERKASKRFGRNPFITAQTFLTQA